MDGEEPDDRPGMDILMKDSTVEYAEWLLVQGDSDQLVQAQAIAEAFGVTADQSKEEQGQ